MPRYGFVAERAIRDRPNGPQSSRNCKNEAISDLDERVADLSSFFESSSGLIRLNPISRIQIFEVNWDA
jgi:hypothetical protein